MGLFSSFGQEVYVYSVSKEEGVVEGFQVKLDQTKSSIEWRSVWVVNFTAASQKIVSVATKSDSGWSIRTYSICTSIRTYMIVCHFSTRCYESVHTNLRV